MDETTPIPPVDAFDISARGRIVSRSSWHIAEQRVNTLALRVEPDSTVTTQPAWPVLLQALGANLDLANRKAADLKPTIDAVNRVIDALNALPADAYFSDLERALDLREPRPSQDRIGDAMNRVLRTLEHRITGENQAMRR